MGSLFCKEKRPTVKEIKVNENINKRDDSKIRFVCISDTHTETDELNIPDGDVLIHAGDFTYSGQPHEIEKFVKFMKNLPHKYKIVIAGNHDITFDKNSYLNLQYRYRLKPTLDSLDLLKETLHKEANIIYLENNSTTILDYNIYGSPYSTIFGEWAFMKSEEDLEKIWNKIPDNTDILITHTPPKYIGDLCKNSSYAGSYTLLKEVQNRIKPLYHIFGHIHEGYGIYTDEKITFINCSTLDHEYKPVHEPVVFDLPLKNN